MNETWYSWASTTERLGQPPLQTVAKVDLSRHTGTSASYTLWDDGEIGIFNRCCKDSLRGEEDSAAGRTRVVDATTNGYPLERLQKTLQPATGTTTVPAGG